MKIALSSFFVAYYFGHTKIADHVILIHQGKIIFEEQKDDLVYNYGVAKCGRKNLHSFPLMIISYTELQI